MKSVSIVFCDITGTLIGKKKNTNEDYKKFVEILTNLQNNDYSDELLFSLTSSDIPEIVIEMIHEFTPFIKNINETKHFYYNGYIKNKDIIPYLIGKPFQILDYLNELKKLYNINKIYFFDDSKMNHEILYELLINKDKLISIIPENIEGLEDLTKILEETFKKQKLILKK